jgi:uncharacterized small protein (DUF1192 family)
MKKTDFDIGAARRLVDAISADLAALPAGSERHAQLKSEVEQLKAMLADTGAAPPAVEAGMRSVHSLVDRASAELQRDGVRAGMFLQDLGRMLGLD